MGGFNRFGAVAAAWSVGLLLGGVSVAALAAPSAAPAAAPVQMAQSAEQSAQNYFYAGFEALRQNRLDEAAQMFEAGLQYSPNNAIALYYLAVTYDQQGSLERAAPLYQRVAALAPGTEEGRASAERLRTAREELTRCDEELPGAASRAVRWSVTP
ncbi:MAG: tetratricopeptide repeat protein, partial [Alphaproteobacteria bacterium]